MKLTILLITLHLAKTLWAGDDNIYLDPKIVGSNLASIVATTKMSQVEAKVLKIYSVKDGNAVFKAYVAMWKNQEVIVSDMGTQSNLKEGDPIKFMAMRLPLPPFNRDGQASESLNFMISPEPEIPVYQPPRVTVIDSFHNPVNLTPPCIGQQTAQDFINSGYAKQMKGDRYGAISDFSKAIALHPTVADNYQMRGSAKREDGDLNGAITDFTKAIELDPTDWENYFFRGSAKQEKRDRDGAIADFTKVIEMAPDSQGAYFCRGEEKAEKGDLDGAIADFTKTIELYPKFAYAYIARGNAKKAKGDQAGADADFAQAEKLKALQPPHPQPSSPPR